MLNREREMKIAGMVQAMMPNHTVDVKDVNKTNGVRRAFIVTENGSNIAPTIYTDNFEDGMTDAEIATKVIELVETHKANAPEFNLDFSDKSRIMGKLINTKANAELLKTVPHIEWNDLSVVFVYRVNDGDEYATALITNQNLHMFKVSGVAELYDLAKANAKSVLATMGEILGMHGLDDLGAMYVVSNKQKLFGAFDIVCMAGKVKEKIGDFTMLPSSIHEVICIPLAIADDMAGMTKMVMEVNRQEVRKEEQLSDHAYKYVNGTWEW